MKCYVINRKAPHFHRAFFFVQRKWNNNEMFPLKFSKCLNIDDNNKSQEPSDLKNFLLFYDYDALRLTYKKNFLLFYDYRALNST